MRRLILCIGLCVLAGCTRLAAQTPAPVIEFDSTTLEAGHVTDGEKITHTFKVVNKGTAGLEILGVVPACGCTSTKWSKKIAPGATGSIEVEVVTEGMTALSRTLSESVNINKTIAVKSNDPIRPEVVLTVAATIFPEIVVSEPQLFFGVVAPGQEVTKEVFIEVSPESRIRLTGVETTGAEYTARLDPAADGNGRKFNLIAVQKPITAEGLHQGTIVIRTSSHLRPELKISLRGIIKKTGSGNAG